MWDEQKSGNAIQNHPTILAQDLCTQHFNIFFGALASLQQQELTPSPASAPSPKGLKCPFSHSLPEKGRPGSSFLVVSRCHGLGVFLSWSHHSFPGCHREVKHKPLGWECHPGSFVGAQAGNATLDPLFYSCWECHPGSFVPVWVGNAALDPLFQPTLPCWPGRGSQLLGQWKSWDNGRLWVSVLEISLKAKGFGGADPARGPGGDSVGLQGVNPAFGNILLLGKS